MKQLEKTIVTIMLMLGLSVSLCPTVFAIEPRPIAEMVDEDCVVFSNLSQLAPSESVQYTIKDHNGNPATVGIEAIPKNTARTGGLTHRVWYSSIFISVEFYMDVFDNQVTAVYDDSITIRGGSYKNEILTHTSTFGKLTFETTSALGGVSGKCWLKGTVTGSNDEIMVDWKM